MKLTCYHCKAVVEIPLDAVGGPVHCPRCRRSIEASAGAEERVTAFSEADSGLGNWRRSMAANITSMLLHGGLLIAFGLFELDDEPTQQVTFKVALPSVNEVQLDNTTEDQKVDLEEIEKRLEKLGEERMAVEPIEPTFASADDTVELVGPDLAAGGDLAMAEGFAGSGTQSLELEGGDEGWGRMIAGLRRRGLDVVVVFDSTGSMGGEIEQVKQQIERISRKLVELVAKVRIGVCTYRDTGDAYVVKGSPLTNDLTKIIAFLRTVQPGGGGDAPEAVHEGLRWAVRNNEFLRNSRKVILVFGDAPPHAEFLDQCQVLATAFNKEEKGIVSTITCRDSTPLPEFVAIAKSGGGEAFLTRNEREIMTQLVVLVFGSRYRSKVVEIFGP